MKYGKYKNEQEKGESMKNRWTCWLLMSLLCLFFLCPACNQKTNEAGNHSKAKTVSSAIHSQDKFYDVAVADNGNVWIVGEFGKVVHSADGGKTWVRQTSGTTNSLLGVDFVNDREGWAVGAWGIIIHTKDGGEKWEKQEIKFFYRLYPENSYDLSKNYNCFINPYFVFLI